MRQKIIVDRSPRTSGSQRGWLCGRVGRPWTLESGIAGVGSGGVGWGGGGVAERVTDAARDSQQCATTPDARSAPSRRAGLSPSFGPVGCRCSGAQEKATEGKSQVLPSEFAPRVPAQSEASGVKHGVRIDEHLLPHDLRLSRGAGTPARALARVPHAAQRRHPAPRDSPR